ncbi:Nucleoside diphosphate kinase [Plasmodiophora brassicae]
MTAANEERSFIMIKPDGVQRGLIGQIVQRFEQRGYFLVGMKLVKPTKQFAERHYSDLSSKPFFAALTTFLSSGPVCAMVWQGKDVVKTGRTLIGATNPLASAPGTIRGDFCIDVGRNVIHGSDSVDSAQKEIALWFADDELTSWTPTVNKHLYE